MPPPGHINTLQLLMGSHTPGSGTAHNTLPPYIFPHFKITDALFVIVIQKIFRRKSALEQKCYLTVICIKECEKRVFFSICMRCVKPARSEFG